MKKILLLILFCTTLAFPQAQQVDAIKFSDKLTTDIRDGIDLSSGGAYLVYNIDTGSIEVGTEDGWGDLGGTESTDYAPLFKALIVLQLLTLLFSVMEILITIRGRSTLENDTDL